MFTKFGSLTEASIVTVADWRKLIIEASKHIDPETAGIQAEFEIDSKNFLYVRARAVSAGEYHGANDNGDYFPEDELIKNHKTFIRRGVFVNHKSEDPATAIGIIIDAVYHSDKRKYVECLLAIDRNEPIAKKIESGIAHSWSMGALVKECVCSVCDKKASSEAEYCDCLRNAMGRTWNGKKVYARNHGCNFYELSNVTVPADPQAYTLSVVAAKETLKASLLALADDYSCKVAHLINKATEKAVFDEVRGRIEPKDAPTDKQILGTVRHRLKVATAPLLSREGDDMRLRVRSALDAGTQRTEKQNHTSDENYPLEGLLVENNLTIRYLPGNTIKDCFFVARRGNLQVMVSADKILDPQAQKRIEAAEKAELIKDESKPKADIEQKVGDESAQPKDKVNPLSAEPAKEIKDESKPKADSTHELGKDPIQPSEVVKRYAQLIGAKSVTFKKGANGSFTAILSAGSISRLASLWKTTPTAVKTAKVGGEEMVYSREEERGEGRNPRDTKEMTWAREDMSKHRAKPAGSSGSEQKSYYQQYDSKNLSEGGADNWARKVNELSRTASKFEAANKELSQKLTAITAERDVLAKALESQKQAIVEEKKSQIVASLIGYFEKAGALSPSQNEVLDLKEQGYSHEDAEVKAYANTVDRKKAELKSLDLKALQSMFSNLSDLVPHIKTASKKDMELPRPSRDTQVMGDEDLLANGW